MTTQSLIFHLGNSVEVVLLGVVELLNPQLGPSCLLGSLSTVQPLNPVNSLAQEIPSRKTGELGQREEKTSLCFSD